MFVQVGLREAKSDSGEVLKIVGMSKIEYADGDKVFTFHVEPLCGNPKGFNMMIQASSLKLNGEKVGDDFSQGERKSVVDSILLGLAELGVKAWVSGSL